MKLDFEIQGIKEIREVLDNLAPRHARNILKNTIYSVAAELRNDIKAAAPVDSGDLRKNVAAKNLRSHPDKPASVVYFKPDGFYWRFVEHGTAPGKKGSRITTNRGRSRSRIQYRSHPGTPARPFVMPAVNRMRTRLPQIINEKFTKALEKAVARELKKRER